MPGENPLESGRNDHGSDDELPVEGAATNWWKGVNIILVAFLVYSLASVYHNDVVIDGTTLLHDTPLLQSAPHAVRFFKPNSMDDVKVCLESLKYEVKFNAGGVSLHHTKNPKALCSPWTFPDVANIVRLNPVDRIARVKDLSEVFYTADDFDPTTASGVHNIEQMVMLPKQHLDGLYQGFSQAAVSPDHKTALADAAALLQDMFQRRPVPKGPFKSCAIVGASERLNGKGLGKEIDSHEAVFRINEHPTKNFEADVGSKTTFRYMVKNVMYSVVSQLASHILHNLPLPQCFNIFSSEQNNADRYDYWSSPEHLLNFETNRAVDEFFGTFCHWNDTILWHDIDTFDHRILEAYLHGGKSSGAIWISKKPFLKDRFKSIFPFTDIGEVVDSTGEVFWRRALSFCETVSLYGYSYLGDTMEYRYYWADAVDKFPGKSEWPQRAVKAKRTRKVLDPDTICRRQNMARLALSGCLGIIRFGDGPDEYHNTVEYLGE